MPSGIYIRLSGFSAFIAEITFLVDDLGNILLDSEARGLIAA